MLHVYEIPQKRSDGYCFAGPVPIPFGNVDWMDDPPAGMPRATIVAFLSEKKWFTSAKPGTRFLVLCDLQPEMTFQMVAP